MQNETKQGATRFTKGRYALLLCMCTTSKLDCAHMVGAGRHGSFDNLAPTAGSQAVKAVIFDLGGVVFDSPINTIEAYAAKKGFKRFALNRCVSCVAWY